jgi:protocatechuate 3,4-dioxygenase beta subunit
MLLSRRTLVIGAAAGVVGGASAQTPGMLRPTPQETYGPFHPVRWPSDHDFDLTRISGRKERAAGQVIELAGRVLRQDGSPVDGAKIDIWQANSAGRYDHPVDRNSAALDPNFQGIARLRTRRDGAFRIVTVKPGAYPEPSGTMRTPHIHFEVNTADYVLATQMYFPGESLNDHDILLSTMAARRRDPALAICKMVEPSAAGVLRYEWDIVLLAA